MFEPYTASPSRPLLRYVVFSMAVHTLIVFAVIWHSRQGSAAHHQGIQIVFRQSPPPPPPKFGPAYAKRQPVRSQRLVASTAPRKVRPIESPPRQQEPTDNEERENGTSIEGELAGVAGGVSGGVVGGTGGGPVKEEPPKPKNVPPFIIQRDIIAQPKPRLSEVFKQAHRNSGPVTGLYKVCVGTDGHVYAVTAMQPIPGADEEIIETIRDGWLYKPQQVPVCFLYNIPITVK